jgi:hypothetical protein
VLSQLGHRFQVADEGDIAAALDPQLALETLPDGLPEGRKGVASGGVGHAEQGTAKIAILVCSIAVAGNKRSRISSYRLYLSSKVAREGLEPPTRGLGNHCSIP